MSKYHDDNTVASDPGGVTLSEAKLQRFKSDLPFLTRIFSNLRYPSGMLDEHLQLGDSRAAIVMEVSPRLIVAAYTDELDCVALLEFPTGFVEELNLSVGDKLLTVNTYGEGRTVEADLENGPESYHRYSNFYPLIAEFLSNDTKAIDARKLSIEESEWNRVQELGSYKLTRSDIVPRNGSPYTSHRVGR